MPQYQGIWTLQDAARLQSQQQWATDPLFENTTLLLQADNAPNAAQNNTFLDSSANAFTITRNGNTTQGSFTPFSQSPGWWSNYFDGSGDYITVPANTAFDFGTGDFTLECWIYSLADQTRFAGLLCNFSTVGFYLSFATSNYVGFSDFGTYFIGASSVPMTNNVWTHVALTRSGTTLRMFFNGQVVGTALGNTTAFGGTSGATAVGSNGGTSFNGYISNARIIKGTALYTSNFNPSTTPLTAVSGTSLLTCQSNRFVDISNNFPVTRIGDVSIQAFSPFAPQFQYTPTVIGGSGYFDGNDFLTYTYGPELAFGTGDFTVEFWMYTSGTTSGILQGDINAGWGLFILSGTLYWQSVVNQTNRLIVNVAAYLNLAWRHWAIVRSGGTLSLYIDGQLITSVADSTNYADTAGTFNIGQAPVVGTFLTGYLSGLRIVKGTAVYTAAFTPPTAPPTAITNTSLLLNYTNAAITDGTMKNNLETVGNAQVSTSIVKYGTGSMAFDGSGDYLTSNVGTTDLYAFGTGDFTIEMWVYFNGVASVQCVYDSRPASTQGNYVLIYLNSDGTLRYFVNSADRITSSALSASTWYHVAVSRSGTSTRLFINGTQSGSTYTDSTSYLNASGRPWIGINAFNTTQGLNGYLDDLRITKGIARYTANFTPPQVALPRQ